MIGRVGGQHRTTVDAGVYFQNVRATYISHSSYNLLVEIDLDAYGGHMGKIERQMNKLDRTFETHIDPSLITGSRTSQPGTPEPLWKVRLDSIKSSFKTIMGQFKVEFVLMQNQIAQIDATTKGSDDAERRKRAVANFIGVALHKLFGTGSEKEEKMLEHRVFGLESSVSKLILFDDEATLILNHTQEVQEEHQTLINDLLNVTHKIGQYLNQTSEHLNEIEENQFMLYQVKHVGDQVQVLNSLMRMNRFHVSGLIRDLNLAQQGILPSNILPPEKLAQILALIESKSPHTLTLPHDFRSEIGKFYNLLRVSSVRQHRGKIYLAIKVPLVRRQDYFNLYRVTQVAVPSPQKPLWQKFDIPQKYIAVNREQTQVITPTSEEALRCSMERTSICTFQSPAFTVQAYPLCALALMLKDSRDVTKVCKLISAKVPRVPILRKISPGLFLKAYERPLEVSIHCPDKSQPDQILQLPPHRSKLEFPASCSATTRYFHVPPAQDFSMTKVVGQRLMDVDLTDIPASGWTYTWRNFTGFAPFNLPAHAKIPPKMDLSKLNELNSDLQAISEDPYPHPGLMYSLPSGLVTVVIVAVVLLCIWKRPWVRSRARQEDEERPSPVNPQFSLLAQTELAVRQSLLPSPTPPTHPNTGEEKAASIYPTERLEKLKREQEAAATGPASCTATRPQVAAGEATAPTPEPSATRDQPPAEDTPGVF